VTCLAQGACKSIANDWQAQHALVLAQPPAGWTQKRTGPAPSLVRAKSVLLLGGAANHSLRRPRKLQTRKVEDGRLPARPPLTVPAGLARGHRVQALAGSGGVGAGELTGLSGGLRRKRGSIGSIERWWGVKGCLSLHFAAAWNDVSTAGDRRVGAAGRGAAVPGAGAVRTHPIFFSITE